MRIQSESMANSSIIWPIKLENAKRKSIRKINRRRNWIHWTEPNQTNQSNTHANQAIQPTEKLTNKKSIIQYDCHAYIRIHTGDYVHSAVIVIIVKGCAVAAVVVVVVVVAFLSFVPHSLSNFYRSVLLCPSPCAYSCTESHIFLFTAQHQINRIEAKNQ